MLVIDEVDKIHEERYSVVEEKKAGELNQKLSIYIDNYNDIYLLEEGCQ